MAAFRGRLRRGGQPMREILIVVLIITGGIALAESGVVFTTAQGGTLHLDDCGSCGTRMVSGKCPSGCSWERRY
jgi:hypothetical protein